MEKIEIRYSILYSILKIIGNLVFVGLGFYILSLIKFDEWTEFKISDYLFLIVPILFIYLFGKKIIVEFLNFNKKIIFSEAGLEFNKKFYEWNNIKKQEVVLEKDYSGKYSSKYEELYLRFEYFKETVLINVEDYKTTEDEIKTLLTKYSKKIKSTNTSTNNKSSLSEIIGFEDYMDLDEEDSEEEIKTTEKICKKNIEQLKMYCAQNLFTETDKISFIYYSLSENSINWEAFLTTEFLRVYEISLIENKITELFPVLQNILIDNNDAVNSDKIREKLTKELDNKNLLIRFQTLELLSYWIDNETLLKNPYIVSKLKQKLKDENWKIRWQVNSLLKRNAILVENLSLMDQLKGKFLNQYQV